MSLENLITKGKKRKPINCLLHGVHGIGKTTFGTKAPSPIFIAGEEIEEIESPRFPKCETFEDFLKYLAYVRDEDHDYKTLVIDTLDSIEALAWKKILKDDNAKNMARACGGFGQAYNLSMHMFTDVRDNYLAPIRDRKGMNIILLCHSTKNKIEDPLTMSSYDMFELKLHKNNKGQGTYTVFSEWVSIIAFANFEVYKYENKKTGKDYAVGEGERRLFCTPKPAYDAKNRFNIPDEINLDYNEIAHYIGLFYQDNSEVDSVKKEVLELTEKITDENLKMNTIKNIEAVGDDLERLNKAKQYILNNFK